MGSFFLIMAILGSILFIINLAWFGWNIFLWVNNGIQFLLEGMNFAERLYESILLKWILLTVAHNFSNYQCKKNILKL